MKNKKHFYLQWWFWITIALCLIGIPFIMSYAYLIGTSDGQPNTAYSASDFILFYGSLLTFLGTISLGILAFWQNNKLSKINEKLSKENNYFQKINAQNLLPVVKIDYVTVEPRTFCTKGSKSIDIPKERYYFSKSHNKVLSIHTGENIELKSNNIKLNIDIEADIDIDTQLYCKCTKFKLMNTSQSIIRHIAFDKIEIVGIRTDVNSINQVTCFNQDNPKAGISTLMSQNEDETFTMFLFYKNEIYNEFWENDLGGLCYRIHITNTTITGISFKQYIDVRIKCDNLFECSYGQQELESEEVNY